MDQIVGSEVRCIVVNLVIADLRAHEDVSPNVVADARSNVHQEMIRTLIAGAKVHAVRGGRVAVEAGALPADATHEVQPSLLTETWLINGIEVEQDGTEGLATDSTVLSLACFPVGIKAEADAAMQDYITSEIHVQSALLRTGEDTGNGVEVASSSPRGQQSAETDHGVALLCRGGIRQKSETGEEHHKQGGLSQWNLP